MFKDVYLDADIAERMMVAVRGGLECGTSPPRHACLSNSLVCAEDICFEDRVDQLGVVIIISLLKDLLL
jgi:hypothetical protein